MRCECLQGTFFQVNVGSSTDDQTLLRFQPGHVATLFGSGFGPSMRVNIGTITLTAVDGVVVDVAAQSITFPLRQGSPIKSPRT